MKLQKNVGPGLKNLSWKKGGLAVSKGTLHCELQRNKGLLNLLDCHWPFHDVKQAIIHHLK